jgi:hypothetical protein
MRHLKTNRLAWLVCALLALGLTTLLLRDWLWSGLPTSPRKEVLTELAITWMFRQELTQGHFLSEWNPLWFSGFPWLRFLSYPIYYIVAAVSAWGGVSLESALVVFYFVVLLGSALTMFGYLHHVLSDWRAALVGALLYEMFPYHNHASAETWIHAAFWVLLPLPLWLLELAREGNAQRRTGFLLLAGIALGFFPIVTSEYTIVAAPFVVLYFALREWSAVRRGERSLAAAFWSLVLVGMVALGTACFFVLPGLLEVRHVGIHMKHAAGVTITDKVLRDYSVTWELVKYAILRRFRLPASVEGLPSLVHSFWTISWYPGLVAPLLLALGLGAARKHFPARAALVGLVLAVFLVSGPTWPLNPFPLIPVLGRLFPFRGVLILVFFLVILAAYGVEGLLARCRRPALAWGLVVALLALLVADYWPSSRAYQATDSYFDEDQLRAYAWIAAHPAPGRLWDITELPHESYVRTYALTLTAMPRHWGYYDNGAPLYTWQQYTWTEPHTELPLHQVRYALVRLGEQNIERYINDVQSEGFHVVYQSGDMQVWENANSGSYTAFYPITALDVTQDFHHPFRALPELLDRNVAMITADSFYLDETPPAQLRRHTYLLVDEPITRQPGALAPLREALGARMVTSDTVAALPLAPLVRAPAQVERRSSGEIHVTARTPQAGLLTIAESWYPHWRVYVDGQRQPLLRANWALQGVWLEAGEHAVVFRYERPWYVCGGYAVSALTWLAILVWWIRSRIKQDIQDR